MSSSTKGQQNRDGNVETILGLLEQICPNNYNYLVHYCAFQTNMAPDTIKYSYFEMFKALGILYRGKDGSYYFDKDSRDKKKSSKDPRKE